MGTYSLSNAERGTSRITEREPANEGHSLPAEHGRMDKSRDGLKVRAKVTHSLLNKRGRKKSGHGKKERKPASSAHQLLSASEGTSQSTKRSEKAKTHELSNTEGRAGQDTERK
jgi:hypothetical protein